MVQHWWTLVQFKLQHTQQKNFLALVNVTFVLTLKDVFLLVLTLALIDERKIFLILKHFMTQLMTLSISCHIFLFLL